MPPLWAFRPSKKSFKILSRTGRKSEGKRGVGGGCGNVVNPTGLPHSHGRSQGGKGEVTFSLRPRRGRSLAPPFPPSARRRFCGNRFLIIFLLEVILWLRISRPLWSSCGRCIGKKMSIWRSSWSRSRLLSFTGRSSLWEVLSGRAILRTKRATGSR